MNWHSDPPHLWVGVYRIVVIVLLMLSLYMRIITAEEIAEVKGIVIEGNSVVGTPTP